jgi:hypothetical protein
MKQWQGITQKLFPRPLDMLRRRRFFWIWMTDSESLRKTWNFWIFSHCVGSRACCCFMLNTPKMKFGLKRSLKDPSTISPFKILSSNLLFGLNEFGRYLWCHVKLCDWIFQAKSLASTMCWAWIHVGYKRLAPHLLRSEYKKESIEIGKIMLLLYFTHCSTHELSRSSPGGFFPQTLWQFAQIVVIEE